MNRSKLLLLPLILIAGVLLYFFVPWKSGQQSVDFNNAAEIVKSAQEKTGQVKNYKYSSDIKAGNQIKVSVSDRVEASETRRQMVDFSWTIPKMSGMAAMYIEGNQLYLYHPLKNKWLLPSEEPTVGPYIDYFWKQLALIDPVENILKLEPGGNNISIYSEAEPKDADSVAVQIIPRGAALAEITKALPPQFAGAELKDVKQYFWISRQDLLVTRYEVHAKVSFFGIKTMDFLTSSKVSNFNETEIKLPQPLVDKMKQGK